MGSPVCQGFPPPSPILKEMGGQRLSACPPISEIELLPLVGVAELSDQREQRQVHRNDHAADHQPQEDDHDRFEGGEQIFHRNVHFVLVEVCNLLQHRVHRAGLLAHRDHLRHHAWKNFGFLQWFGKRFSFFQGLANLVKRALNNCVAGSLGGDIQAFQDRDAAGDKCTERASEARDRDLAHQHAKDWQL